MATYKGINGFAVQSVATDPSPLDEGQVWYNNATYAFKLASVTTAGTFASGGNLNTARMYGNNGGAGTQTAALSFSGAPSGPGAPQLTTSESYNGTSWTATPSLNTGRAAAAGCGATNTAALCIGGQNPSTNDGVLTESFNGTSWSPVNSLNTGRYGLAGVGIQTAALAFGGENAGGGGAGGTAASESWNGTSWTTTPSLNTLRRAIAGLGLNTAAVAFGGVGPGSPVTSTELWNGSSWTNNPTGLNTARRGARGGGTSTAGIGVGGSSPGGALGSTELWNGSTWTSSPTGLTTARDEGSFAGTQTLGVYAGGNPGPGTGVTTTEEWTGPGSPTTKTITTS
jgi:hypothetical protein